MMLPLRTRLVGFAVLGVLLLPSLRQVDTRSQRRGSHRRHAVHARYVGCRGSSSDEARLARRVQRRMRRAQERARIEAILMQPAQSQAAPPEGVQAPGAPQFSGLSMEGLQTAANPDGDDSDFLKRKRRRARAVMRLYVLDTRPKILPRAELVGVVRQQVDTRDARLRHEAEPLPHFGSGPCHSIPRPREGTIALTPQSRSAAA